MLMPEIITLPIGYPDPGSHSTSMDTLKFPVNGPPAHSETLKDSLPNTAPGPPLVERLQTCNVGICVCWAYKETPPTHSSIARVAVICNMPRWMKSPTA